MKVKGNSQTAGREAGRGRGRAGDALVHRLKSNLPKGHLDGVIAPGRELVKEVKLLEDVVGLLEGSLEKGEIPGKVISKIAFMRHQLNLLRRSRHCTLERL